jgi:hypothetical protein
MTLKATRGSAFAAAFGSFADFVTRGAPRLFPDLDPTSPAGLAALQQAFDQEQLLDGIEAWVGGGPADAQACVGDDGGPITAQLGGATTVFGVASWSLQVNGACELDGTAYASMNPVSLDFIDYETHCPLIPRAGTCDGPTVAVRCATPGQGGRRELRTDCSELGQVCGVDGNGALGCIDDPCAGLPPAGTCNGDVATRCSLPGEGPRRVVTTDCSALGESCTLDGGAPVCGPNLSVVKTGSGSGTVTSSPAGISCGADCSESYAAHTVVTLTAAAAAGSVFAGWSGGGCSGTATCVVTVDSAVSVTATFSPVPRFLVATSFQGPNIEVFPVGATGDTAPLRTIAGSATTLVNPRAVAVFNDEMFVADQNAHAIDVFPVTASGNVAPVRRITGALAGLQNVTSVLVSGGELYVANQATVAGQPGVVDVFPLAASGNVAPSRVIAGINVPDDMAIVDGELYVVDRTGGATGVGAILVFPASASGATVPTRVITGAATGLQNPIGMQISNGEIFVTDSVVGNSQICVFSQLASGNVAPLRTIHGSSTRLAQSVQITVFAGEIYVADAAINSVVVFPVNANGNIAPAREIHGPSTGLRTITGVFVF